MACQPGPALREWLRQRIDAGLDGAGTEVKETTLGSRGVGKMDSVKLT